MTPTRNAVITINIGTAMKKMADLTIPTMRAYAERVGADFIVIDKIPETYQFKDYSAYWAKFVLRDYLETYNRILYLDLDTTVTGNCPNLFELVPEAEFGALAEDDFNIDQSAEINLMQEKYGQIGWTKGYFNVGVMLASQAHKAVFELHEDMSGSLYPEQSVMNYNLQKNGIPLFKLSHKFNHMYFLNVPHNQRSDSYISHYAGISQQLREAVIEEDLRRIAAGERVIDDTDIDAFVFSRFTPEQISQMPHHSLLKDAELFVAEEEPA